jgi:hypothetical protein
VKQTQTRLTQGCLGGHNHVSVSSFSVRLIVGLTLAPYIALSVVVGREHVHEADADHPQSAVHRHLELHSDGLQDDHHTELAKDDEHIVWLTDVALHQPAYRLEPVTRPPIESIELMPVFAEWASPPDYDTAPPHGPPRACLALRAPPLSLVLI